MLKTTPAPAHMGQIKADRDAIFFELTRSICPECRRVIDAQILLRDNKVIMRKRCPEHGMVEALIYGDTQAYLAAARFNKPGTIPLAFTSAIEHGCPHDCGLCPDHQQHACLGIIEVNSACNMDCPLCFANAGAGFNLTLEEVEGILDDFVCTEEHPEVVQFSGGEPTIHPRIIPMIRAARARPIRHVMINTNGKRIANDDAFLAELAELRPTIYFQFDGFERRTYEVIRAEPDILPEKPRALDRLAATGCPVILVPAVERGVNEQEVGRIVRFVTGDAERLPFPDASFDAVICECAFCTFPDKPAAAAEFARVLRDGGRVGLSDLTRNGPLPRELDGLLAWIACIADARPLADYEAYLQHAGFRMDRVEPHDEALQAMVQQIRTKLMGVELLAGLKKLDLPNVNFATARAMARSAAEAARSGTLGYALLTGTREAIG